MTDQRPRLVHQIATTLFIIACVIGGCDSGTPVARAPRNTISVEPKTETGDNFDTIKTEFKKGNLLYAKNLIQQELVKNPDNADALSWLAQCHAKQGNYDEAIATLKTISQSDRIANPTNEKLLAHWTLKQGNIDEAQAILQRAVDQHPDSVMLRREFHDLLSFRGRRLEANQQLQPVIELGKATLRELFSSLTLCEAFEEPNSADERFDAVSQSGEWNLNQAASLRSDRDFEPALKLIERLRQDFPDNPSMAALHGKILSDIQANEQLAQWWLGVPSKTDDHPSYWHATALLFAQQNKPQIAVRCYCESLLRDPTNRQAYLELARTLSAIEHTESAERVLQRFQTLEQISVIGGLIAQRRATRAELVSASDLLQDAGRPWEALAWAQQAAKLAPDRVERLKEIEDRRIQLRQQQPVSDDVILCGLALEDWPLPTSAAALAMPINSNTEHSAAGTVPSTISFADVSGAASIDFTYDPGPTVGEKFHLHQITGGGIGVIDYDVDGKPDLYFAQAGCDEFSVSSRLPNAFYRNMDGSSFRNYTTQTHSDDRGYGQGIDVADLNQDGLPDLVVANIGPNCLMINQGDGTFQTTEFDFGDQTSDLRDHWTTSVACGDLTGDHLPDLYEVNYIDDPRAFTDFCDPQDTSCIPSSFRPAVDRLFRSSPEGRFVPSQTSDLRDTSPNFGFGILIANFDESAGNDVYIANDTESNSFWLSHQTDDKSQPFSLRESAAIQGCAYGPQGDRRGSMGISWGDFDRNGRLDLHVTNYWMQSADLYLQDDHGQFRNSAHQFGLANPSTRTVGWGSQSPDFDCDGYLDCVVLNGHVIKTSSSKIPYQMLPQISLGTGRGFQLIHPSQITEKFFSTPTLGRTIASLDFNSDGKIDLVANSLDTPAVLLENTTPGNKFVSVQLVGTDSERDAVGAKVTITIDGQPRCSWVVGGGGFLCANESKVHFGIENRDIIDQVQIDWPSGKSSTFETVLGNSHYLAIESSTELYPLPPQ